MQFGVLTAAYVDGVVVRVVLTVVAALVVWAAVGPHCDLLPKMFSPRGLPLELLTY